MRAGWKVTTQASIASRPAVRTLTSSPVRSPLANAGPRRCSRSVSASRSVPRRELDARCPRTSAAQMKPARATARSDDGHEERRDRREVGSRRGRPAPPWPRAGTRRARPGRPRRTRTRSRRGGGCARTARAPAAARPPRAPVAGSRSRARRARDGGREARRRRMGRHELQDVSTRSARRRSCRGRSSRRRPCTGATNGIPMSGDDQHHRQRVVLRSTVVDGEVVRRVDRRDRRFGKIPTAPETSRNRIIADDATNAQNSRPIRRSTIRREDRDQGRGREDHRATAARGSGP